jgi:hypothetical protein
MKTLTELRGSVIRAAAAATAEARRSLPTGEKPAAAAIPEAPAQGAAAATGEAPAELAGAVEETAAIATPPVATPAPPAPTPPAAAESGAAKEAIDAAVAKATGLSGDRLAMLRGALEAAGRRTEDVRLVRVFGLDEQVTGATKVGEYQYVADPFPASMAQSTASKDDRGRRGAVAVAQERARRPRRFRRRKKVGGRRRWRWVRRTAGWRSEARDVTRVRGAAPRTPVGDRRIPKIATWQRNFIIS